MPDEQPPQFFHEPVPPVNATHRAVYSVQNRNAEGEPYKVVVECVEGGGNVPQKAASFMGLEKEFDLKEEFASVVAVAESVLSSLKALRPGEVEVEFGIELGGKMGIPLITQGEAKSNFKIKLKWKEKDDKG